MLARTARRPNEGTTRLARGRTVLARHWVLAALVPLLLLLEAPFPKAATDYRDKHVL